MQNAPTGYISQAELIKKIGFDGLGLYREDDYKDRWETLNTEGLSMPELYWPLKINEDGIVEQDQRLVEIMEFSKGRDLLVAFYLSGSEYKTNRLAGDKKLGEAIQKWK